MSGPNKYRRFKGDDTAEGRARDKARRTYGGRTYQSIKEARYAAQLDALMNAAQGDRSRVLSWKPQVRVPLHVAGVLVCSIVVDFVVVYEGGREEYQEVKSEATMTNEWRIKSKLFQALYPDAHYRVVR